MKTTFIALLALLSAAIPVKAQLFTPQGDAEFQKALLSLYNLNYDESRAASRHLIELEPENPFSYLAESGMIWWQSSNEFGLFKDTPTLEGLFEDDINNAVTKGQAQLDEAEDNGKDEEKEARAHFVIGMALGTRGEWRLIQGHWLNAYFDGKHGVKHLNECIKLKPEFYDAYIGLGLYDYMTDHLPRALKISTLFFIHGNAKRGLDRMQLAYERAQYTPSYAAEYLASIYIIDQHDDAKAMPMVQYLRTHFPDSPYFKFIEIESLVRMKDPSALQKAKAMVADAQKDPAFLGRKQLSLWCGLWGNECLNRRAVEETRDWLSDAISKTPESKQPSYFLHLLHFYRGVAYDLSGRRNLAIADYDYVTKRHKFAAISALAQHCLDEACTKEVVMGHLKDMSLELNGSSKRAAPAKARACDNPDCNMPPEKME